jgi:N-acetylmuramic acid 6-phosphate etherase
MGEAGPLPPTEAANPASLGIDKKSAREIVEIIHQEDHRAWEAVGASLDGVAALVERVVGAFRRGGRLIYVGAGTSGRLGALDAAECPPTFGVPPDLVVGVIAGGDDALRISIEGAEDSPEDGARAVQKLGARDRDVVCGIATSGRTPFVLGALEEAARRDATTALVACNPLSGAGGEVSPADLVIDLPVGPEVIAGSTRMKGGTATKMVLNMITTAAMVRWGKVYDNLMVDLRPVNRKLRRRAIGLVERVGAVHRDQAAELLRLSGDNVKAAIVMARRGVGNAEALKLLEERDGLLRAVIDPE